MLKRTPAPLITTALSFPCQPAGPSPEETLAEIQNFFLRQPFSCLDSQPITSVSPLPIQACSLVRFLISEEAFYRLAVQMFGSTP